MDDSPLFRVRNIGMDFGTKKIWLDNVDIPRGRLVCFIGPSGAGKSTCLHLLGGLCLPNYHRTSIANPGLFDESRLDAILHRDGRYIKYDLRKPPPRAFKVAVAFVFQSSFLLQSATTSANIALGSASAGKPADVDKITRLAERLRIEPAFLTERSRARSAGERQRIALARALVRDPAVIFADEPTANLDPPLAEEIIALLKSWCSAALDRSVIWVTHDVQLAARFADEVIALHDGALGNWSAWPQSNPGDSRVIRQWIEGRGERSKTDAPLEAVPAFEKKVCGLTAPTPGRKCTVFGVWTRIGISEIFSGAQADRVPFLRRMTSVSVESQLCEHQPAKRSISPVAPGAERSMRAPSACRFWASWGHKLSVLRLSLLITAIAILWSTLHHLTQNLYHTLNSPTLNPVVVTSRAQIDDQALADLQRQLAVRDGTVPYSFGRYEFGSRRLSARSATAEVSSDGRPCANPQLGEQIQLDIAALDPMEPMLTRVEVNTATARLLASNALIDRSDGVWNVLISLSARDELRRGLRLGEDPRLVCLELRGTWIPVEIVGVFATPPRGRHGPYDMILSATQWRDFGSAEDRALYETAAIYFDSDPSRSTEMISLVRALAAQIVEPPNTRLVQSLSNDAGFERIAAALERTFVSTLFVGFLGAVSFVMIVLMISEFVSTHVENNLRAISVALALGAGFGGIVIIELTRLTIVLVASAFVAIPLITVFGIMQQLIPYRLAAGLGDLFARYLVLVPIIIGTAITLTLLVSLLRIRRIRSRSLSDQLKALD